MAKKPTKPVAPPEDEEEVDLDSLPVINIGDTDENADWIKTPESRAREKKIHERLAKRFGSEAKKSWVDRFIHGDRS